MAYDPLSTSTRHTRRTLIVASLASVAINLNVAEINKVSDGIVSLNKPNIVEIVIMIIMIWAAFAFGFAARVDYKNSERTSLERQYVKAWEEFHSMVNEPEMGYLQDESGEETYSNELFKMDLGKLEKMDPNERAFKSSIKKLEGSRNALLEKMPNRGSYVNKYGPIEAAAKFWIVDIIMPYSLFFAAILFYFSF